MNNPFPIQFTWELSLGTMIAVLSLIVTIVGAAWRVGGRIEGRLKAIETMIAPLWAWWNEAPRVAARIHDQVDIETARLFREQEARQRKRPRAE